MPTTKPTVTSEHHARYEEIMKTQTVPVTPARESVPNPAANQPSKVSALLASLPKPKGIGNKMFVFTGKKKIVLDPAGNQDIKDIKTVDAPPLPPAPPPPEAPKKVDPESLIAKNVEVENRTEHNEKPKEIKESKDTKEVKEVKQVKETKDKTKQKMKLSPNMVLVGIIILLGGWTFFWMYFLGYF